MILRMSDCSALMLQLHITLTIFPRLNLVVLFGAFCSGLLTSMVDQKEQRNEICS